MKNILFIIPTLPPYRKTFYEKLTSLKTYKWLIAYNDKKVEDGRPQYEGELSFPIKLTHLYTFHIGNYEICFQKGALSTFLKFKPNILILHANPGIISNLIIIFFAKAFKIKIIMWICAWEKQKGNSIALKFKQLFMRVFYNLSDRNLLYSSKAYNYLSSIGVHDEKMEIAYNGIEIDDFIKNESLVIKQSESIRNEQKCNEKIVLLYVGGMLKEKKVDLLIKAYSRIKEKNEKVILWLVGHGPEKNNFEQLTINLGLRDVIFFGRIIDGVDPYFAACDLFILPGVGGLALNQAMFWGKPCIVSEADGTEDDLVLEGKTGFRFIKDNELSLCDAIQRYIAISPSERIVMGSKAKELIVNRSNVTKMVEMFHENILKLDSIS